MKGFRPDASPSGRPTDQAARRAYEELRRRILEAELQPGDVVNEVAMSETLHVSRTPLREAFRELLNEGLLDGNGPRRQATVRKLTMDELAQIGSARAALEPVVLDMACAVAGGSEPNTADLLLAAERMRRAARRGDLQRFLDADEEFHVSLADTAQAAVVEDILFRQRALTRVAVGAAGLSSRRMRELCELHEQQSRQLVTATNATNRRALLRAAGCGQSITDAIVHADLRPRTPSSRDPSRQMSV